MSLIKEALEEAGEFKNGRKELRQFGLTMGSIFIVIGLIFLWRKRPYYPYCVLTGLIFFAVGTAAPLALKRIQKIWIMIGLMLGFFVSRVLLALLFYGIVTPMALVAKALGKDLLDQRIDRAAPTYWRKRPPVIKDRKSYEKQF